MNVKRKPLMCVLIALSIAANSSLSRAQNKMTRDQIASQDMKLRMAVRNQKFTRVIVELNNGSTISGLITSVSDDDFNVMHHRELIGPGPTETIRYSDVATLRRPSPGLRVLKRIAVAPAVIALAALSIPVCQISILLKHPVLCPCYSGLP